MPPSFEPPNPEAGFVTRARSWRELLPWLRLGDALQPSASLVALALSLAAYWLTAVGIEWLDQFAETAPRRAAAAEHVAALAGPPAWAAETPTVPRVLVYFVEPLSRTLSESPDAARFGIRLLQQLWLWLLWMIPAGYLLRQSLLHAAGRLRMPSFEAVRLVLRRPGGLLGGPLLPLLAVGLLAIVFVVIGWCGRIPAAGPAIATVLGWISIPLVLVAGMLIIGLGLAFPLIWAAAVAEEYADGFDTASRGFEYLYQRPLRYIAYYALATLISLVATTLVFYIVHSGTAVLAEAILWTEGPFPAGVLALLESIPHVYAINLFWALSAVIYLLLRRDANHQEIEDLWEPATLPPEPLPDLQLGRNPEQEGESP